MTDGSESLRPTSVTCALPVPDITAAEIWYAGLLGREPDLRPDEGVLEWRLVPGCWLQLVQDDGALDRVLLRLGVDDLDAATTVVTESGGRAGERTEIDGVIAFCDVTDPYGNRFSLYQELAD